MEQFPPELWCDVDSVNVGDDLDVSAGASLFAAAPAAEFHLRRVLVFNILLLLRFHLQLILNYSLYLKLQDLEQTTASQHHHLVSPRRGVRLTNLFIVVGLF